MSENGGLEIHITEGLKERTIMRREALFPVVIHVSCMLIILNGFLVASTCAKAKIGKSRGNQGVELIFG